MREYCWQGYPGRGRCALLWGSLLVTVVAPTSAPAQIPMHVQAQTPVQTSARLSNDPPRVPALAPADAPLVLRGVTVIDVRTGRRLPNRTVVIVGTRIQAMGRAGQVRVPIGAHVVEGRGKYLIPGLWDCHVHTRLYADADVAYPLFLANGVTGIRDAGTDIPLATIGQWKREIAAGARPGPRLVFSGPLLQSSPRLSSDTLDTAIVVQGDNGNDLYVPLPGARRAVDSLKAAGTDLLKIYGPRRRTGLALIADAKRVGLRFGGHSPEDMSGQEFSDSGALFLDHGSAFSPPVCGETAWDSAPAGTFDGPRCAAAVARLRQNGTWIVPTLYGFLGFEHHAALARRYRTDSLTYANFWQDVEQRPGIQGDTARLDSLAAALEPTSGATWLERVVAADSAGAWGGWASNGGRVLTDSLRKYRIRLPLVLGTDVVTIGYWWILPPGFGVHEALMTIAPQQRYNPLFIARYQQPTNLATLQTATLNPALALGATDSLGTIGSGKVADLVLLDADPLADIWNTRTIRAVIANGRYYDRAALDGLLHAAQQAAVARRARARLPDAP